MAAITPTPADVKATSGTKSQVVLGAALTAGQMAYKDTSDENEYKAASNAASATATGAVLLLSGGADGQPGYSIRQGDVEGMGASEGVVYVLGETGAVVPVADLATGDWIVFVGVGKAAGTLAVDIREFAIQVQ